MRLPRFILGMICALIVFAVVTYSLTGSFWTTVLQTLICAVLVQAGYFVAIVFLVAREKSPHETSDETEPTAAETADKPEGEAAPSGKTGVLQSLRRIGTPK